MHWIFNKLIAAASNGTQLAIGCHGGLLPHTIQEP
jgi:hypothetical protein